MTESRSPSLLYKILKANESGSSIILRSLFTTLFFVSIFILIGVYSFFSSTTSHPSSKRIALLTYLSLQSLFFLAGMALPWKFLLYPFRRVMEENKQDVELQTYSIQFYQEPQNELPPPLMKRTFTVLKTTLRPSNSFRVVTARKGGDTATDPEIHRNPTFNSTSQSSRNPSTATRNPSVATRHPSNSSKMSGALRSSSSNRSLNRTPQSIIRITHPLESLTVTQPHNKLDFTTPPPISRRNTGSSERSYRTREQYELESKKEISDTLRKLEGIRLSTVGEDRYSHGLSIGQLELVPVGRREEEEEVPELSDGESDRDSSSSGSSSGKGEDGEDDNDSVTGEEEEEEEVVDVAGAEVTEDLAGGNGIPLSDLPRVEVAV